MKHFLLSSVFGCFHVMELWFAILFSLSGSDAFEVVRGAAWSRGLVAGGNSLELIFLLPND